MKAPIRTAIVGRGMATTVFHEPLVTYVADLALTAIAGRADAPAVIADPGVELIVIATPNATHFDLARAALTAGKHVVIDKPAVLTVEHADQLAALAAAKRLVLAPFHNRRWDGDFMTSRDVLQSGRLGEVRLFTAHWDRFRPRPKGGWREVSGEGSGLLWDIGPHMIDQLLLLFGRPDAIQADLAIQRGGEADDYFEITAHYGAMRAVLGATTIAAPPRPRFAFYGTAGSFTKPGLDPQEEALKGGGRPADPGFGQSTAGLDGTLLDADGSIAKVPTVSGAYVRFYEAVARSIAERTAPPVTMADARDGVELILAAHDSARTGRRIAVGARKQAPNAPPADPTACPEATQMLGGPQGAGEAVADQEPSAEQEGSRTDD